MRRTQLTRFILFGLVFALVLVGLISHNYGFLVGAVILAIVVGVIADRIEKAPTEQFKKYNELHHRDH